MIAGSSVSSAGEGGAASAQDKGGVEAAREPTGYGKGAVLTKAPAVATSLVPTAMAVSKLPVTNRKPPSVVALLPAPRANAELKGPVALALLLAPTATAKPASEAEVLAVPKWSNVAVPAETDTFGTGSDGLATATFGT